MLPTLKAFSITVSVGLEVSALNAVGIASVSRMKNTDPAMPVTSQSPMAITKRTVLTTIFAFIDLWDSLPLLGVLPVRENCDLVDDPYAKVKPNRQNIIGRLQGDSELLT